MRHAISVQRRTPRPVANVQKKNSRVTAGKTLSIVFRHGIPLEEVSGFPCGLPGNAAAPGVMDARTTVAAADQPSVGAENSMTKRGVKGSLSVQWKRSGAAMRRLLGLRGFTSVMRPFAAARTSNTIMFHIGRSGSTVLGDLLRQHPSVFWDGEIFAGPNGNDLNGILQKAETVNHRWHRSSFWPERPIEYIRSRMPLGGFRSCYGIEIKFFHLSFNGLTVSEFVDQALELGFNRFIVLERRNWLRKVVSSVVAHRQSSFHIRASDNAVAQKIHLDLRRIQIDSDEKPLLDYFDDWTDKFAQLRTALRPLETLELNYEQHVEKDPALAYRECCEFLKLGSYTPEVRLGRTNPFSLSSIVENWVEVEQLLLPTPYAWMLADQHPSIPAVYPWTPKP